MAEKTVYIIDLNDKVTDKLKTVGKEAKKTDESVKKVNDSFKGMKDAIVGVFAGSAIVGFGQQLITTTAQFQSLSNSIKFASDTSGQGELSMSWLKNMANDYGLPLKELTEGFKTFQGAMMNTKFTSNDVRTMFGQVSTSAVAMGLSADDAKGVFLALGQIMSKGKVSAEELRGQIGERVPGAFNIAARSMNLTASELDDMMKKGKILSEDFLPKFAAEMERTFSQGAIDNSNSLTASINRLSNSWENLILTMGGGTGGIMGMAMDGWGKGLNFISDQFKSIDVFTKEKSNQHSLNLLANIEKEWKAEIEKMKAAGKSPKEINEYLSGQAYGTVKTLNAQEGKRTNRIGEIEEDEFSWLVKKNFMGRKDRARQELMGENDEYERLRIQSATHAGAIKEIGPLADKLISALFMAPAGDLNKDKDKDKDKKKIRGSSSGLTLNESRNGATNITFNIDTFQKNEFSKDGTNINNASVKAFLDQMAAGLLTVLNDSQIVARQ